MSKTEVFADFLRQLERDDAEHQILVHDMTAVLREKLRAARKEVVGLEPLVDVVDGLLVEVARLSLQVRDLKTLRRANAEAEARVLSKLESHLDTMK